MLVRAMGVVLGIASLAVAEHGKTDAFQEWSKDPRESHPDLHRAARRLGEMVAVPNGGHGVGETPY